MLLVLQSLVQFYLSSLILDYPDYAFEETEIPNVIIVHLYNKYCILQAELLNAALLKAGVLRPVFWIYNGYFQNVVSSRYSVLNIFHGTEDYLASESHLKIYDPRLLTSFNRVLEECQLLIAVSEGVADSFKKNSNFK